MSLPCGHTGGDGIFAPSDGRSTVWLLDMRSQRSPSHFRTSLCLLASRLSGDSLLKSTPCRADALRALRDHLRTTRCCRYSTSSANAYLIVLFSHQDFHRRTSTKALHLPYQTSATGAFSQVALLITAKIMESDRALADLGPDLPATPGINGDTETQPKQPKRRFIGRRAADAKAASKAEAGSGSIEETGAVQGACEVCHPLSHRQADEDSCCSAKACSCSEQCARRSLV